MCPGCAGPRSTVSIILTAIRRALDRPTSNFSAVIGVAAPSHLTKGFPARLSPCLRFSSLLLKLKTLCHFNLNRPLTSTRLRSSMACRGRRFRRPNHQRGGAGVTCPLCADRRSHTRVGSAWSSGRPVGFLLCSPLAVLTIQSLSVQAAAPNQGLLLHSAAFVLPPPGVSFRFSRH